MKTSHRALRTAVALTSLTFLAVPVAGAGLLLCAPAAAASDHGGQLREPNLGQTPSDLPASAKGRARSVILLFMWGGPAQQDTWDPKPTAPATPPLAPGAVLGERFRIVALLGRSRAWGVFVAGLLFGALKAGSFTMQASQGIPVDIVLVVQSLIVLFIANRYLARVRPTEPVAGQERMPPAVP